MTVPWAAHWIARGHCRVRQKELEAERATRRAGLRAPVVRSAPPPNETTSRQEWPHESATTARPQRAPSRPAHTKTTRTISAPRVLSSGRITSAESLAALGVRDAWRRADRFVEDTRDADRVAALISADDTVLVEDGFVIQRATWEHLAAVGDHVQAAVARVAGNNKARGAPERRTGCKP